MQVGDLVRQRERPEECGIIFAVYDPMQHVYSDTEKDRYGGRWLIQWQHGRQEAAWGHDLEVINGNR